MRRVPRRGLAWVGWMLLALAGPRVVGVIPFTTSHPATYEQEPVALGGGGWAWTGRFGPFTGVPIGPSSFITAAHIGQSVGTSFTWNGQTYRTVATDGDGQSDLQVWHVCGAFPGFAPRVSSDLRKGEGIVVIGRGTGRGDEVLVDRGLGPETAGWLWGANNGVLRWGTNTVDSVADGSVVGLYGPVVLFDFDGDAGDDECSVSVGDSGGPVWVQRSNEWQLAAINFATDSEFRTTPDGPILNGALFDFRGLYRLGSGGVWELEPANGDVPAPASSVSTRLWPRRQWVDGAIQRAPGPAALLAAGRIEGPFAPAVGSSHDPVRREFRIPVGVGPAFFRVSGPAGPILRDIRLDGARVVVRYD